MAKYEKMRLDMNEALKAHNALARETIGDMVAAIDKAAVSDKTRVEITDEFVDGILLKYLKIVQEQIDTCPSTEFYAERRARYMVQRDIVRYYAPKVIDNPDEIKAIILSWIEHKGLTAFDKKIIMPLCKKAGMDMKVVNEVVKNEFC